MENPKTDSKKEPTFAQELHLLINKDIDMESLTIKQYYNIKVQGIIEDLQKQTKKEIAKRREETAKRRDADAKRKEETAMRKEEIAKRKEAEQGLTAAVQKLYAQGMPVETIADTIARSAEFVQGILNKKK